jgi:hypothetical protein
MKTKTLILSVLLLLTLQLRAQVKQEKYDFRMGTGVSILGTGDMITLNVENEFNFKISPNFSNSVSLNYGKSNLGIRKSASFIQGNINIFVSPFGNKKKNDFRIGLGLSYYDISDAYIESSRTHNGQPDVVIYKLDKRNALGFNIIIEQTYSISNSFLMGFKLFTQSYFNEDINTGAILKFGFKI